MTPRGHLPVPDGRPPTTVDEPGLLRSGSILIYCRSSLVLSLLVFAFIATLLYSDLYVHLIRQSAGAILRVRVIPGAFPAVLAAACCILALRLRPLLEKAALLILALNFVLLMLRSRMGSHSTLYLLLCASSLALDLALLGAVVAFYRKYPNVLKRLRREEAS